RSGVELYPRIAIALDPALDHQEEIGPHRLRTAIAAPCAPDHRSHEEESDAGHDEKAGDIVEFLRPDFDEEEIEPPAGKIDQHRLIGSIGAAIPSEPRRHVVDAERHCHDDPFEPPEISR